MALSTVRVQLIIWNVAVLTFILLGCGVALHFRMHAVLNASLDWELKERASAFLRRPSRPAPWPFPGVPPGPPPPPFQGPSPNPDDHYPAPEGMRTGTDVRLLNMLGRMPFSSKRPFDTAAFKRSMAGEDTFTTITDDIDTWRIYSTPDFNRSGKIIGAVQSRQSVDEVNDEMTSLDEVLLTLLPAGLIAAAIGAAFLSTRALRPVRSIASTMERIQAEDLTQRLFVKGQDEFAGLANTFNSMLGRLEASFDHQRRFTSDASHELRTPLAVIKAKTSVCLTRPRSAEAYLEVIEAVDRKADEMTVLVQNLLTLARADHGLAGLDRRRVLVRDIFTMALDQIGQPSACSVKERPNAERPSINVDLKDPDLEIECAPADMTRVIGNLITNACRHTPTEGTVTLSAVRTQSGVEICVQDTGEGISSEHISHLGQRFYRVDSARNRNTGSTGLGLAICRSILEAHNGQMTIESTLGIGTTIHILLPA